jgi:hypothetical protein
MLNKKILAAAIAAGLTTSAFAIDVNDTTTQVLTYASEAVTADVDGRFTATNLGGALDIDSVLGFTIAVGTNKYIRYQLTDAVFDATIVAGDITITETLGATAVPSVAVSQGGAIGDDFVILEISTGTADLAADDTVNLATATFDVNATGQSSVSYALYETAADAVNQTTSLSSGSGVFTTVASGNTGDFVTATEQTATVASVFTLYTGGVTDEIGLIDGDQLLSAAGYLVPGGGAAGVADVATLSQEVTIAGDFSFGDTWFLHTSATCAGGATTALTVNEAENSATSAADITLTTDYWLCNTNSVAEDTILKGSYVATLVDDGTVNTLGTIIYDTTAISINYLTTFAAYNQRIYIINTGTNDASYTTSFLSEAGVTATAGTAATGVVPAGEMVAIKASDLVTLTGKTRTSATIEIEADDSNIVATSQTVNLGDGSTDTLDLLDQ